MIWPHAVAVKARAVPELGIRIALGARQFDMYRAVIGTGLPSVLTGIMTGIGIALAFTRFFRGMLTASRS